MALGSYMSVERARNEEDVGRGCMARFENTIISTSCEKFPRPKTNGSPFFGAHVRNDTHDSDEDHRGKENDDGASDYAPRINLCAPIV